LSKKNEVPQEVTGDYLTKLIDSNNIKIVSLANFWGIDRNTISSWKRRKNKKLPNHKIMLILIEHLLNNLDQLKTEKE